MRASIRSARARRRRNSLLCFTFQGDGCQRCSPFSWEETPRAKRQFSQSGPGGGERLPRDSTQKTLFSLFSLVSLRCKGSQLELFGAGFLFSLFIPGPTPHKQRKQNHPSSRDRLRWKETKENKENKPCGGPYALLRPS